MVALEQLVLHSDLLRQLVGSVDLVPNQQPQRAGLEVQEALAALPLPGQLEDLEALVDLVHQLVPELLAALVRLLHLGRLVALVRLRPLLVVLGHLQLELPVDLAHRLHLLGSEAQHRLHQVDLVLGDSEARPGQRVASEQPLRLLLDSVPHQQLLLEDLVRLVLPPRRRLVHLQEALGRLRPSQPHRLVASAPVRLLRWAVPP